MSTLLTVKHAGIKFKFSGSDNCSVSETLSETGGFYELDFLTAVGRLVEPGSWAVDIGAHIGNHSIFMAKVLGLRVMAFEANPATFSILKANIAHNDAGDEIGAQNMAIGDKEDIVSLTPLDGGDIGSFSVVREVGPGTVRCKSKPLDFFKDYFETRPPAFIKLDIEGAEDLALEGAKQVIFAHRPIIATEVMSMAEFEALSKRFLELGYFPEGVYNATPTVIWCPDPASNGITNSVIARMMNLLKYAIRSSFDSMELRSRALRSEAKVRVAEAGAVKKLASKPAKKAKSGAKSNGETVTKIKAKAAPVAKVKTGPSAKPTAPKKDP